MCQEVVKMDVEQAFIKSVDSEKVISIVEERLNGALKELHLNSQMEVPDSYDVILADDVKRKVAVSSPRNGWITIIESKEVNDYTMLFQISKELRTEGLAVIQSDITGSWGFAEFVNGEVINSYFSEEDDDIEDLLEDKLNEKGITGPLYMFREVVRDKGERWKIVQKHI